jgi:hypothetical protein
MQLPGSPLLKTTLPSANVTVRAGSLREHAHVDVFHSRLAVLNCASKVRRLCQNFVLPRWLPLTPSVDYPWRGKSRCPMPD